MNDENSSAQETNFEQATPTTAEMQDQLATLREKLDELANMLVRPEGY